MLKPSLASSATVVIILCTILLGGTIAASSQSAGNEKLPAGPGKEKAQAACLTCHDARIIVQQRLSKAAWTKEVDKMVKWGADVDPKDRDVLIDYLSANVTADQPPYVAPRSVAYLQHKSKQKQ